MVNIAEGVAGKEGEKGKGKGKELREGKGKDGGGVRVGEEDKGVDGKSWGRRMNFCWNAEGII